MTDGMTSSGIPTETMVKRVDEYITSQMPVTAILHVVAPVPKPLDITLDILPDDEAVKAKIESAIESVVLAEAVPGGAVLRTSIDRAISGVSEVKSYRIVTPTDDVSTVVGEIYVPGTITWV